MKKAFAAKNPKTELWNEFYERRSIPWQSEGLSDITQSYLKKYAKGKRLLEIGCGTGDDARGFMNLGFVYTGCDISEEGIRLAKKKNPECAESFLVEDFFSLEKIKKFSVLYDKGVFHNLVGPKEREAFVEHAASLLEKDGIWITICGSADNYDPKVPHGAIYLQHLIAPAEMCFEIVEIVKAPYGAKNRSYDGWYCVFQRR